MDNIAHSESDASSFQSYLTEEQVLTLVAVRC